MKFITKPQAQTLQQRMGFVDADLTSAGHDKIMEWLDDTVKSSLYDWINLNDWTPEEHALTKSRTTSWQEYEKNMDSIKDYAKKEMQSYKSQNGSWDKDRFDTAQKLCEKVEKVILAGAPPMGVPDFPTLKAPVTKWEPPLLTETRFTIGFIDLLVTYKHPHLSYDSYWPYGRTAPKEWRPWNCDWIVQWSQRQVFFEVKTVIPSLGELFRQLTMYQVHGRYPEKIMHDSQRETVLGMLTPPIFVVSPDDRFAAKIREQGYGFIRYTLAAS